MRKYILLLSLSVCAVVLAQLSVPSGRKASFVVRAGFHLDTSSNTSAGVYKVVGGDTFLIRTLWSNVRYPAGNHTAYWDSKNDADSLLTPGSNYFINVTSNNLVYAWDGVIGNTSANNTGEGLFSRNDLGQDVLSVGGYGYIAIGFSEGKQAQAKFDLNNPTTLIPINGLPVTAQSSNVVCSDGVNIYFGGIDAYHGKYNWLTTEGTLWQGPDYQAPAGSKSIAKSFVFAISISDNSQVTFSSGVNPLPVTISEPDHYESGIDVDTTTAYGFVQVTGLAVQKAGEGNYLFSARGPQNLIHVINKTTGALVHSYTNIFNPQKMFADHDTLFVIHGTGYTDTLSRYIVGSDGSLVSNPITFTGSTLSNPCAVTVSPQHQLVVCDAGTSQQVKFFNKSTGAFISAFGQAGGYLTETSVSNDRFMFASQHSLGNFAQTSISFNPADSSFLLNDYGNFRFQQFDKNRNFKNTVMSIGNNYSVNCDPNNPTRVFVNYLEFEVDYSKPLLPSNGSWRLNKNWGGKIVSDDDEGEPAKDRLKDVTTFPNGRTYAWIPKQRGGLVQMVELSDTGLRKTGYAPYYPGEPRTFTLEPDGSLFERYNGGAGGPSYVFKHPYTGEDGSHNPIWGASQLVTQIPATDIYIDPLDGYPPRSRSYTTSGVYAWFKANRAPGYHIGGSKFGGSQFVFKSSPSTYQDYIGHFPNDGTFDIGNTVNNAGGWMQCIENSIFYNYVGEFWGAYANPRAGQTNKINHFYHNGLFLGQFGEVFNADRGIAAAGMAGNAYCGSFVKVGNAYYMYHGDESHHAAIHRWSIKNIASIKEQKIAVMVPNTLVPPVLDFTNLMAGLPFNSYLPGDTVIAGWTFSGFTINQLRTSLRTYNKRNGDDVSAYVTQWQNASLTKDLGSNIGLTNWTLSGAVQFLYYSNVAGGSGGVFVEVLDNTGKIMFRFYHGTNFGADWWKVNEQYIDYQSTASGLIRYRSENNLVMNYNAGTMTIKLGDYAPLTLTSTYDTDANLANPAKFRVRFIGENAERNINVQEFKLKKTP